MKALVKNMFLILVLIISIPASYSQTTSMQQKDSLELNNKIVPDEIWREAYIAFSHYPELKDTPIEIRFKNNIKKSFMQAQPKVSSLLKNKKDRSYIIFINREFNIEGQEFNLSMVPSEVLIGWLGHEMGHIMDYQDRSSIDLVWFGIKYFTSKNYIREAERAADTYAVNHGLGEQIIATKNFILNHSQLSDVYKNRIADLYLSPDEIMVLIDEIHEEIE